MHDTQVAIFLNNLIFFASIEFQLIIMVMVCFLRLYLGLKGAVSRNSAKIGNYKIHLNQEEHENNH